MFELDARVNGNFVAVAKRFNSMSAVYNYIDTVLATSHKQVSEEFDGINGHELVCDFHTRFYIHSVATK
ncbi:MAG: hypothetical protein K6G38_00580 [Gammaproteobacteria bacterium]|nr:hypothetical protein [Gammaproteobacteria bacterium]